MASNRKTSTSASSSSSASTNTSSAPPSDGFVLSRPCDNMPCLICSQRILKSDIGATIAVPHKDLKKALQKKRDRPALPWSMNKTVDYLHYRCWEATFPTGRKKDTSKSAKEVNETDKRLLLIAGEDSLERFDNEESLRENVAKVVEKLLASKQTVCFTGAGISVSAGLMTYRGTEGIDTQEYLGIDAKKKKTADAEEEEEEDVDYTKLQPTRTHNAIARLHDLGKMDYCITQNCDDLHAKAGLDRNFISDLHGNVFIEYCEKCMMQYIREYCVDVDSTDCMKESYAVKCRTCGWNHYTGRRCDSGRCKGKLKDTIVNFGDDLHQIGICGGLMKANLKARHADLCICLGSSLSVSPANTLPTRAKDIVIVNLQTTDLDEDACVRVWGRSDDFFDLLMPEIEKALGNKASKKTAAKKASVPAKKVEESNEEEHLADTEDEKEVDPDEDEEWDEEEKKPTKGKKRSAKGSTSATRNSGGKRAKKVVDLTVD